MTASRDWGRTGSAIAEIDVLIIAQLRAAARQNGDRMLPFIDEVPAFSKLGNGELTPRHSLALLEKAAGDVHDIQSLIAA